MQPLRLMEEPAAKALSWSLLCSWLHLLTDETQKRLDKKSSRSFGILEYRYSSHEKQLLWAYQQGKRSSNDQGRKMAKQNLNAPQPAQTVSLNLKIHNKKW